MRAEGQRIRVRTKNIDSSILLFALPVTRATVLNQPPSPIPRSSKKRVEVAAAVLQRPDGAFLLAQRPPDKVYAGYWEFPGGKIEPGETAADALARELHEELGIEVGR